MMKDGEDKKNRKMIMRRNVALALIILLIASGTIIIKYLENWTWVNAFYFVVATSATVGYGDIAPKSEIGRLFTSVFILLIVPIVLYSFTIIAEILFENRVEQRTKLSQDGKII
jgi:hypothetical protein